MSKPRRPLPLLEPEFVLLRASVLWAASKNRSYRAAISESLRVFVSFMSGNGLFEPSFVPPALGDESTLLIRRADLTLEGFAFYVGAEQRYFKALGRGTPPHRNRVLASVLREIRANAIT